MQNTHHKIEKNITGILALFLGNFGIHRFYMNRPVSGLLYLLFFWTFVPAFIALIEGIYYLCMSETEFNRRFNPHYVPLSSSTKKLSDPEELEKWHKLMKKGVITKEEYEEKKKTHL